MVYNKNCIVTIKEFFAVVSVIDSFSGTLLCQKKLTATPESIIAVGEGRTFAVFAAYEKVCVSSLKKHI